MQKSPLVNPSMPQSVFVKHLILLCWHEELSCPGFRQMSSVPVLLSSQSEFSSQVMHWPCVQPNCHALLTTGCVLLEQKLLTVPGLLQAKVK